MPSDNFPAINQPPGHFVFSHDAEKRPTTAEGWLVWQPGARQPEAQASVSGNLSGYHAGHLIPARFGGPGGAQNLVPMPEVVNISYVKAVENAIGRYLKAGPLYLRVTVEYAGDGPVPAGVHHELFRRSSANGLDKLPGGDVFTNVKHIPGSPMSAATDLYTGKKVAPKHFLDTKDQRGRGPNGLH